MQHNKRKGQTVPATGSGFWNVQCPDDYQDAALKAGSVPKRLLKEPSRKALERAEALCQVADWKAKSSLAATLAASCASIKDSGND